jgi:nucleoside-diphosphate-sugar epimerase
MIRTATPDVVFHLAGHVTGSQALGDVEPTFTRNLTSTVHLLISAAEVGGCRVVQAGSMQEPDLNDVDAIPVSPYAASKWACTGYARMFHRLYQFPVVIARLMMVYGPGQWDVTKLLPYVMTTLLSGSSPSVSSGTRMIDWIFIDDVVAGMMVLGMTPKNYGQTIDLGSGVLTSIREIVEHAAALIGSNIPIAFGSAPDRPYDRPRTARTEETRRLTGWSAETSLAEGLRRTVEYWRVAVRDGVTSATDGNPSLARDEGVRFRPN